jgi:hypothetical protein
MKKFYSILCFILFQSILSQTIEIGPTFGFQGSRIDDSDFFNDSPSIGKSLWRINYGFQTILYLKNPKQYNGNAFFLNYYTMTLGARSENGVASYRINTNSLELGYRMVGNPIKVGRFYMDIGLGMNIFSDKENIYFGNNLPSIDFPNLEGSSIKLKENEYKLVLGMGYDFHIHQNFNTFFEVKVCGGFTNINSNPGSYINTYIAFNTGIRYIINFKEKK